MKTIVNNVANHPPAEVVMHAIKNYTTEDHSEKSIVAVLKEINASVKTEERLKRKTRNGGYVAWPQTGS